MSRFALLAASFTLIAVLPAHAAKAVVTGPFPIAADGTTNIADCAKAAVANRNECISKSRPLTGKQVYARAAAAQVALLKQSKAEVAKAAKAAKLAKAKGKTAKPATVASAAVVGAKGFAIDKNGTTNVADCAKAVPAFHNECISRARPLTATQLAAFVASRSGAAAAVVAAPVVVANAKGFKIAKDGTTDITDCAGATPEFRNECISRARPVSGAAIYASMKSKS